MDTGFEKLDIVGEAGASASEAVLAAHAPHVFWHVQFDSLLACHNTLFLPQSGVADMSGTILCQNRWPTTVAGKPAMSARSLHVLADSLN